MDHLGSRRRAEGRSVDFDSVVAGLPENLSADPAEQAERHELGTVARHLVEALPDDCRRSFVLTQLDGYSYDDAAAIEGLPRGTVASRVYRAKRLLLDGLTGQTNRRIDQ